MPSKHQNETTRSRPTDLRTHPHQASCSEPSTTSGPAASFTGATYRGSAAHDLRANPLDGAHRREFRPSLSHDTNQDNSQEICDTYLHPLSQASDAPLGARPGFLGSTGVVNGRRNAICRESSWERLPPATWSDTEEMCHSARAMSGKLSAPEKSLVRGEPRNGGCSGRDTGSLPPARFSTVGSRQRPADDDDSEEDDEGSTIAAFWKDKGPPKRGKHG